MGTLRLGVKMALVLVLTLAILVPLSMIRGIIHERQHYRDEVVRDVASNFGGRQVFGGPVLVVPYVEITEEDVTSGTGEVIKIARRNPGAWTYFPETLAMDGELQPDTRKRGLHEVRVYQWNGVASARFDITLPPAREGDATREIGRPWLSYGIADVRGLRGEPTLSIDGQPAALAQGIGHADGPGLHLRMDAPAPGSRLAFDTRIELRLRGTETFAMMPYGRSNDLRLRSPWPHPKFEGPSPQQDIDGNGFSAHWQIAAVASNAQRRYQQNPALGQPEHAEGRQAMPATPLPDSASVSLLDPVNPYSMADRATKYGLLFVGLTFVGFFMFELVRQVPVHPIQYGLVGLAIAIFFLLLLALSEHFPFGGSYLAAACACIGLIGYYLAAVLRSRLRAGGFAAMLAMLYAALYGLLVSEDNALALGAGLLFVVLAAIMAMTRKVDWYQAAMRGPASA